MTAWTATVEGVTIGAGTKYRWATMPEGFGVDGYRTGDIPFPRQDGVVAAEDRLNGRMIAFDVWVLGDGNDQLAETRALTLKGAFQPKQADVEMTFSLTEAVAYTVRGRPRGCTVVLDKKFPAGVARARCSFWCTDPRLYGELSDIVLSLPSGTAGLTFPAAAPFAFGALTTPGEAIIVNTGTYETDWSAYITGPIDGPSIEVVEQGRVLALPSLSLAVGEYLFFDSRTKSILLNDFASRYSSLSAASRWWMMPPGTSTIRFRGNSGSGQLTFLMSSAYL